METYVAAAVIAALAMGLTVLAVMCVAYKVKP